MSDQFSDLVRIVGITILITFLWAASVAFTYWDMHHQRLSPGSVLLWMVLVTLLPVIGFVIYLIFRTLTLLLATLEMNTGKEPKIRRETALKHPMVKKNPMPTILASDLGAQTVLDPNAVIQSDADFRKVVPRYTFTVSSGADFGKEFIIGDLPARIGRGSGASIRLDGDLGVSRQHAEIYDQAGILRIRDLNSTHGTKVNGLRILDQSLESGDHIQIGMSVLVLNTVKEG